MILLMRVVVDISSNLAMPLIRRPLWYIPRSSGLIPGYRLGKNNPPVVSCGSVCIYSVVSHSLDSLFDTSSSAKFASHFFRALI